MIKLILGLGNPGSEYENTRHNSGRNAAMYFAKKNDFGDFEQNKKSNSLVSEGKVGKSKITVALPETFMNKSGNAAGKLFKAKKENYDLVVIHDDLD
ncbi:MAG: aminoacyl-tRNA hydrolase, partial [bacterium]|nr:aminoacyl-tRNA hydrolase [bacterium]